MEIRVGSADAALRLCREMLERGEAQLFRGQSRDWPRLIPTLFRFEGIERDRALKELEAFREWATHVPQMVTYWHVESAITAIAQHYGIPTNLLDLTSNPEIAVLFSRPAGDQPEHESVIFCFNQEALERFPGIRPLRIDVHNLWRLEAQSGLFLEFADEQAAAQLRDAATRIYFPAKPLSALERTRLYPVRKSALEIVLDQWFYRHQLEEMLASITAEGGIKFSVGLRRHTYPGAFRWRLPPDLEASWIKGEPGWIFPSVEPAGIASDPIVVQLPLPDLSSPEEALTELVGGVSKAISEHVGSGKLISFAVSLPASNSHLSGSIDTLINRCWDGIRLLPFRAEDLAYCLGLTVTLLVGRAMGLNVDDWPERLFGEVELLEVAPVGGHIEAGLVSKADLLAAFSSEHHPKLTAYMRRKAIEDPLFIMNYIVDHWMIFDFEAFQRIFVRQLIPTMMDNYWREDLNLYDGALGCLWSINFNPALLGYVTHVGYRFTSPLGMQKDCSHIIYILPDMDQEDIAEAFISCMPWILGKGDPYLVLFHGYAHDTRNIWKIHRAIRHARWICEVGGISVLEPMPSLQNPDDLVDEGPQGLLQANGMGALEVWLMAKEKLEKMNGKPLHIEHPVFKRFWSDLMVSNAKIDQLATSAPDWPGPLSEA